MSFSHKQIVELCESERTRFRDELLRELPPGHVMIPYSGTLDVLAHVEGRDDFVIGTGDPNKPFAVVHLTWLKETTPPWPYTEFYQSAAAVDKAVEEIFGE
ncbi:hypothetical protein [Cognatiyoonia sp. IB215182]|uniref:hypothetical protein n=1 Tax=Cognatiyoonia sp. IB215182 TaxID=3097353 RepID=UPI002A15A5F2|nr:hypothetical protein [Cognatiyoonia sp. IB215182]MDX8354232.1 hypothetical protein [Cognatiyoonia sp. IB215182]